MARVKEYYTRISNDLIRSKKDDIDKKLLLVMIYLDRRRSIEDYVGFSLHDMIHNCGYTPSRNKQGVITMFKKQIEFLIDNGMISMLSPMSEIKGNNYVYAKINDAFDCVEGYTIMTCNETDKLLSSKSKIEKSNLFAVYLYMRSFMFPRATDDNGHDFADACDKPCAFWKTIDNISYDLGIARETINRCINEILKLKLLVRHETGSYKINENGKYIEKNVPNIYVLYDDNASQEIKWAVKKLKEFYNVESFGRFKRRRSKINNNDNIE